MITIITVVVILNSLLIVFLVRAKRTNDEITDIYAKRFIEMEEQKKAQQELNQLVNNHHRMQSVWNNKIIQEIYKTGQIMKKRNY